MPRKAGKRAATKTSTNTPPETKDPVATRPDVPPSYGFPTSPKGLLGWEWARQRLADSHNYVIVTVRPDGRPHAMGMHGLWIDDAFYFGTGDDTRKAKNLAANPHCILINERLDELIIVEGTAETVALEKLPSGGSAASKKKYGWPMEPGPGGVVYKLTPRVVFAFPEKQITTAITRWKFL